MQVVLEDTVNKATTPSFDDEVEASTLYFHATWICIAELHGLRSASDTALPYNFHKN